MSTTECFFLNKMRCITCLLFFILIHQHSAAQDSAVRLGENMIYLKEVVVGKGLDVPSFIQFAKEDTGFYKAFKNLRVLQFRAINDIRMYNRKGRQTASLFSSTFNEVKGGCRQTKIKEETTSGDFYDEEGAYNYYTASLYASLFFTKGKVCGESNLVGQKSFDVRKEKGIEKHKEMLKMLFFYPGKTIPGLPGIGNKLGVFESPEMDYYEMIVDLVDFHGEECYFLKIRPRADLSFWNRNKIVLTEMDTWFAVSDFSVLGKSWKLDYNAGVYDFDVTMEAQLKRFGSLTVPVVMRYNGDWDVPFKRREKGVFTATLSDFSY
jgi:hypothetical protein